jgi:hypothetical protein
MALPVTGPETRTLVDGTWYKKVSTGYRQKRPYDIPLLHKKWYADVEPNNTMQAQVTASSQRAFHLLVSGNGSIAAYDKAYGSLVDKLGEGAGMGINIAQRKQTFQMLGSRFRQLDGFTTGVIRRDKKLIARSLSISERQVSRTLSQNWGVAKTLANTWLEFWFGWKPLLSDIHAGLEALDAPVPDGRIKGSGTQKWVDSSRGYAGPFNAWYDFTGFSRSRLGCDVRVTNIATRTLQQWGLLNPAAILWDSIKYSFVIDWFANVSQYIGSFTDFAGLEISNAYQVTESFCRGEYGWNGYPWKAHAESYDYARVPTGVTIAPPKLMFKELKLPATRALTALSLLTQKLNRRSFLDVKL